METLSKDKPYNRHSPERSRKEPRHLSINAPLDNCPKYQFRKPIPSNKNLTDIAGALTTFYESNDDKFFNLLVVHLLVANCKVTLLKSHFGMGVLLQICLFLRIPLVGCF